MDKLSQQELVCIRRGAEDAIQAMNRNHKSFIEAVSHPLNIIALVDMAQASIGQQAKVEELQKRVDSVTHLIRGLRAEFDLWMDVECPQVERQIELLEQALKGEG